MRLLKLRHHPLLIQSPISSPPSPSQNIWPICGGLRTLAASQWPRSLPFPPNSKHSTNASVAAYLGITGEPASRNASRHYFTSLSPPNGGSWPPPNDTGHWGAVTSPSSSILKTGLYTPANSVTSGQPPQPRLQETTGTRVHGQTSSNWRTPAE